MSEEDDAAGGALDEGGHVMPAYVKLLVADAARARAFYEGLGFEVRHTDQVFTHLRWARGADVFLVATPPGMAFASARGAGVIVCFSALAYWRVTGTALVARLVSMVAMAAGLVVVSTLPPAWPLAVVSASLATLVGWEAVRRPG